MKIENENQFLRMIPDMPLVFLVFLSELFIVICGPLSFLRRTTPFPINDIPFSCWSKKKIEQYNKKWCEKLRISKFS